MSWTHAICGPCYASLEPGREPVRVTDDWRPPCCWCKSKTDGIYYRADPKVAQCGGDHGWDA